MAEWNKRNTWEKRRKSVGNSWNNTGNEEIEKCGKDTYTSKPAW